tara:strand:+ start:532 stop:759 length:228 start_codon:yes stop_codon:yes gene_type:complete
MGIKQQQLTPFEQAAQNRQEAAKRLAGVLVATAMLQRAKQLKHVHQKMSQEERIEWDAMLMQVIQHQIQHFGYDA